MEDLENPGEGQASGGEHHKEENLSLEELKAELKKERESKARILAESKGHAETARVLKAEREAQAKKKLEEKGEFEKLLNLEKDNNKKLKNQTIKSNMRAKAASLAPDAHDVDMLLAAPEFLKSIEVDEETLEVLNVDKAIEELKKSKSYLFRDAKNPKAFTQRPNVTESKPKSIKELSKIELEDLYKKIRTKE